MSRSQPDLRLGDIEKYMSRNPPGVVRDLFKSFEVGLIRSQVPWESRSFSTKDPGPDPKTDADDLGFSRWTLATALSQSHTFGLCSRLLLKSASVPCLAT